MQSAAADEAGAQLVAAAGRGDLVAVCAVLSSAPRVIDFVDPKTQSTALVLACSRGARDRQLDVVRALLGARRKPNVNAQNANGMTALICATTFGHVGIVQTLLQHTPAPLLDVQDNDGMSALMHAVSQSSMEIINMLMRQSPRPSMDLETKVRAQSVREFVDHAFQLVDTAYF